MTESEAKAEAAKWKSEEEFLNAAVNTAPEITNASPEERAEWLGRMTDIVVQIRLRDGTLRKDG